MANIPIPLEIPKLLGKQANKKKRTLQNAYVCDENRNRRRQYLLFQNGYNALFTKYFDPFHSK